MCSSSGMFESYLFQLKIQVDFHTLILEIIIYGKFFTRLLSIRDRQKIFRIVLESIMERHLKISKILHCGCNKFYDELR